MSVDEQFEKFWDNLEVSGEKDIARSAYMAAWAKTEQRYESLFEAIAHGSQEHRDWLRDAIQKHMNGLPVPTARG